MGMLIGVTERVVEKGLEIFSVHISYRPCRSHSFILNSAVSQCFSSPLLKSGVGFATGSAPLSDRVPVEI